MKHSIKNNLKPIDIILVSYNRLNFLKKTIDEIKNRTLFPYRLIVVDNNSEQDVIDYLKEQKVFGIVHEIVFLKENVGQAMAQNKGLELVDSEYFVITQNDLIPPKFTPCWLERLKHLMDKHQEYACICMRINRTRRVPIDESKDLIENFKSIPAVFRMHRTDETRSCGENPFGNRLHWESSSCMDIVKGLKKKAAMATHLYADHFSFKDYNKGYHRDDKDFYTWSDNKIDQGEEQPYPDLDPNGSNIPIKINDPKDTHEHALREDFWGIETGKQNGHQTSKKSIQRGALAEYIDKHGGKWADLGCGNTKVHPGAIGIDSFPFENIDIVHNFTDLWFFEDGEMDGICGSHSFEHVADIKKFLKEIDRVLKVGGILAFITPDFEVRPKSIREESHKFPWTVQNMIQLINRWLGYKIVRLEQVPGVAKTSLICVAVKR